MTIENCPKLENIKFCFKVDANGMSFLNINNMAGGKNMTAYKLPKRQFAALMALIMILSMMTGCFGKDKSEDVDTKTSTSSSADTEEKSDEKSPTKEDASNKDESEKDC